MTAKSVQQSQPVTTGIIMLHSLKPRFI